MDVNVSGSVSSTSTYSDYSSSKTAEKKSSESKMPIDRKSVV